MVQGICQGLNFSVHGSPVSENVLFLRKGSMIRDDNYHVNVLLTVKNSLFMTLELTL